MYVRANGTTIAITRRIATTVAMILFVFLLIFKLTSKILNLYTRL